MQFQTTVVIPLYKSAQFIDTIIANIESIPAQGVEVVISDHHCLDNTIDYLADRYAGDPRIRCLKHHDKIDWVSHLNILLQEANGEYWRFLPHDDLSPSGSLEILIKTLNSNKNVILAYGPTKAIDYEGIPIPEKDKTSPHPVKADLEWTLGLVLEMYWKGYFNGAFKGLIRRKIIIENQLLIRNTKDQIFPERCWLFALGLLGQFHFVPEATYIKRFYKGSVHSEWKIKGSNFISAAQVMSDYLYDIIGPGPAYNYGCQDLWLNAHSRALSLDIPLLRRGAYRVALSYQSDTLRKLSLPLAKVN